MSGSSLPQPHRSSERGGGQRILLVVLFLLVGAFGYLYFFTGLIKPREEGAKPGAGQGAPVKKPIPPRPGGDVAKGRPPAKADEKKPAEQPAARPVAVSPQPPGKASPSPSPAKPAAVPAKPAAVATGGPATPPAQPVKSPAVRDTKGAASANKAEQTLGKKADHGTAKKEQARGEYTLQVGEFVAEPSVRSALAKVKKAGIAPVAKTVIRKSEPMIRLFLAEFDGRAEASEAAARLKGAGADSFTLPDNGKYAVYAGSYFLKGKAIAEQDRLNGKGFKTVQKNVRVSLPVVWLTAGSYPTGEDARRDAARLKKLGLTAMVLKTGK